MIIEVLELLPGKRAIVSTEGLQRVVMVPTNRIIDELLDPEEAAEVVIGANAAKGPEVAVAIDYEASASSVSS